jgi:hypothetical protein
MVKSGSVPKEYYVKMFTSNNIPPLQLSTTGTVISTSGC